MPRGKRPRRSLAPLLFFTWLLALVLAAGLAGAAYLGVFTVASPLPALPSPTLPAAGLPPTWTPAPAAPTPSSELQPAGIPGDVENLSVFEPTNTPADPFPPTPTFAITPMAFFDGPFTIGTSAGGRPIEAYRFGTGAVQRMLVFGIHGGYEWNTVYLADELIEYLQDHPDAIPRTVTLYVVRNLNPDGFARAFGVDGRVNDNGVDLNRNFPVNWASDWDRQHCWNFAPTSAGISPGSEPETRALIDFVNHQTRVTALISYHSAALGIFPGGDPPDEESARLAQDIADISTYAYPPIDTGCVYTGTLADWAAAEGIAAVDLELHDHANTDFDENLVILEAFLDWRR